MDNLQDNLNNISDFRDKVINCTYPIDELKEIIKEYNINDLETYFDNYECSLSEEIIADQIINKYIESFD
jgi:hypothetical protein